MSETVSLPPAELFRAAARLIERATEQLDTSHTLCGRCGGVHYNNRDAWKLSEQFAATPSKLRQAAARLDNPSAPAAAPGETPDAESV